MITKEEMRECAVKLHRSQMRILSKNGFYGSLLMHTVFAVDTEVETVSCDSRRIYFNPQFLAELTPEETDYVLMHQVLHIALMHVLRGKELKKEYFDDACDIVVDSNIYHLFGDDESVISIKGKVSEHKAPDGTEGYKWSAEQLYEMLLYIQKFGSPDDSADNGDEKGKESKESKNGKGSDGDEKSDDDGNGESDETGETAIKKKSKKGNGKSGDTNGEGDGNSEPSAQKRKGGFDSHSKWDGCDDDGSLRDEWLSYLNEAVKMEEILNPSKDRGTIPLCAERLLKQLAEPQIDWRQLLIEFVQQEVTDYSFSPPDRRFDDSPFFLPDFNEKTDCAENILFMIDTSGSMSDTMIAQAYSEINGAIEQYNGALKGWLGFFDAMVVPPVPFENEDEFKIIRIMGGGGTDFEIIFDYVREEMLDIPPACIIILTDGYAPFPEKEAAGDIPVMWLINNNEVNPPWGRIVRINDAENDGIWE